MENHQLVFGNARLNISEAEIQVTCDIEKWEVRFSVSQASFLCVRLSCRLRAACDFDKRSEIIDKRPEIIDTYLYGGICLFCPCVHCHLIFSV